MKNGFSDFIESVVTWTFIIWATFSMFLFVNWVNTTVTHRHVFWTWYIGTGVIWRNWETILQLQVLSINRFEKVKSVKAKTCPKSSVQNEKRFQPRFYFFEPLGLNRFWDPLVKKNQATKMSNVKKEINIEIYFTKN